MTFDDPSAPRAARALTWPWGHAELQPLGAMLGPVTFRAPGHADFAPLQVAPWADEPALAELPGILQRLRGDWPCVPFGRTDRPDLPAGWQRREPEDGDAGHGHGANHAWRWIGPGDPAALALEIDYPASSAVRRLVRRVAALPDAPGLRCTLEVEVRRPCRLPVALHPVLRLDRGRVALQVSHAGGTTYPVPAEPGVSRLAPDAPFERLDAVPLAAGGTLDLARFPLAFDTEELLQLHRVDGPVTAVFEQQGWSLSLDWDHAALPDVMLWISHRGRHYPPWNGRHWAIGIEPLDGPFDLGRIADPPAGHAVASRRGIALAPGRPWRLDWSLTACPIAVPAAVRPDAGAGAGAAAAADAGTGACTGAAVGADADAIAPPPGARPWP